MWQVCVNDRTKYCVETERKGCELNYYIYREDSRERLLERVLLVRFLLRVGLRSSYSPRLLNSPSIFSSPQFPFLQDNKDDQPELSSGGAVLPFSLYVGIAEQSCSLEQGKPTSRGQQ